MKVPFALLLLPMLLAAPALAQDQTERSYALVRLTSNAEFIGFPAVCPGSSPDEDQSQIVCLAELYEANARVLRQLGGPELAPEIRVRFTAHSFHAVWRRGVRMVLGTLPFEDQGHAGQFAFYWDWEKDGELCQIEEDLDGFPDPVSAFFRSGTSRTTDEDEEHWSEDLELRCAALDGRR